MYLGQLITETSLSASHCTRKPLSSTNYSSTVTAEQANCHVSPAPQQLEHGPYQSYGSTVGTGVHASTVLLVALSTTAVT